MLDSSVLHPHPSFRLHYHITDYCVKSSNEAWVELLQTPGQTFSPSSNPPHLVGPNYIVMRNTHNTIFTVFSVRIKCHLQINWVKWFVRLPILPPTPDPHRGVSPGPYHVPQTDPTQIWLHSKVIQKLIRYVNCSKNKVMNYQPWSCKLVRILFPG